MDSDQPIGIVVLIKDITRLQQAEKARDISRARYRELVETINEVLYSLDSQGMVTYISPGIESLTGFKIEEILGKDSRLFIHPDDLGFVQSKIIFLFKGHVSIFRSRLLRKNGNYCWVQTSSKPVIANGQITGANGILTDITEQVKAQEEKIALMEKLAGAEKMKAIGALAGMVAHKLNNVLSGIVSYPELLLMDLPHGSKQWHMVKTIKTSGEKAAAIVEDLLILTRQGVVCYEPVDINQIVKDYLASPEFKKLEFQDS